MGSRRAFLSKSLGVAVLGGPLPSFLGRAALAQPLPTFGTSIDPGNVLLVIQMGDGFSQQLSLAARIIGSNVGAYTLSMPTSRRTVSIVAYSP